MSKLRRASCSLSFPLRFGGLQTETKFLFRHVEVFSTCPEADGSTLCSWPTVSLAAELTGCLGVALMGVLRLPLILLTAFRKRSCIIEGVSSQPGISYRWTRAQAHLAVMEEEEPSCYHCIIDNTR